MGTSPNGSVRPIFGVLATALNFPMVFAGLVAIAVLTNGDDEVALVNLWACWGVFQALLGQIGLVQGALDRLPWRNPRVLRDVVIAGLVGGGLGWTLRESLFPGHHRWWLALACIGSATLLIGRMRGLLSTSDDGVATVVITAVENAIRSAALIVLLVVADTSESIGFAVIVVVSPFIVSAALLVRRWGGRSAAADADTSGEVGAAAGSSIWTGVLASLPAVGAYAVVPGLTLLDRVADIDAFAIATSLLRGPLLVATFASAWLLQEIRKRPSAHLRLSGMALALLVALHLFLQSVFEPGLVAGLVVHGGLSGAALFVSYIAVLWSIDELAGQAHTTATMIVAVVVFVAALVASTQADWVHPFVSLTLMATVLTVASSAESAVKEPSA